MILALRIASALLDARACIRGEPYGIGVLRLLFEVALCSPDERVISYILDPLLKSVGQTTTERYLFVSVEAFTALLNLVQRQVKLARVPYLLNPKILPTVETINNDSTTPEGQWVAVHGRTAEDAFFNDYLWLAYTD